MTAYIPLILKYVAAGVCIGLLAWMAAENINTPGAQSLSALLYSILGALGLHAGQQTVPGLAPKPPAQPGATP